MIRLDWVLTGLVVLATFIVIFMVGVVAVTSGMVPWLERFPGSPSQTSAPQTALPPSDTPGRDLPGVDRYPESVRVKYERYDLGEADLIEVGYLMDSELQEVSDFYEELASSGGWQTLGSDIASGDELGLLMARGEQDSERKVFIEIEPQDGLVSVEMEGAVSSS